MKYRPTPPLVAALLALVSFAASAHDVTLTWKNATQMTDGSAIPTDPADKNTLRDTRVRYGTCNATKDAIVTPINLITVPSAQPSLFVTGLPDGTFCFQAQHSTVGAAANAVLPADGVSSWSAMVNKTFVGLKKPKAPNTLVLN